MLARNPDPPSTLGMSNGAVPRAAVSSSVMDGGKSGVRLGSPPAQICSSPSGA